MSTAARCASHKGDLNQKMIDVLDDRSSSSSNDTTTQQQQPHPSSSSPHGWTDDEFITHLSSILSLHPLAISYPEIFALGPKCICHWRKRYNGNPRLWKRMYDEKRVLKEFIEAVPIVTAATTTDLQDDGKYTIIDLACGRGYLSMILSECLPPTKVERFVLVDKGWPMHGTIPGRQHISWEHIYGIHPTSPSSSPSSSSNDNGNGDTCVFIETEEKKEGNARTNEDDQCNNNSTPPSSQGHCYYSTWPIPLNTAKVDLKKSKEIRMLERRLLSFDSSSSSSSSLQYTTIAGDNENGLNAAIANTGSGNKGPIILVAIHLCGTLSLKAVDLFNNNPRVRYFCLKPCCLPGMVHVKRHEMFHLGKHTFDSKLVCMAGRWNKNEWKGPHRNVTKVCFDRWVENLYMGINDTSSSSSSSSFCDENTKDCGGDGSKVNVVTKVQKTIPLQNDGGYQNEFLFAERRSVMGPS